MPSKVEFFQIHNRRLWGDYGSILISGYSEQSSFDFDGVPLQCVRTGPFVPPIFRMPAGRLIFTDAVYQQWMRNPPVPEARFRSVVVKKVVEIPWHTWDQSASEPPIYPRGGEPESYITSGKHSKSAAVAIGKLWEAFFPMGGEFLSLPGEQPWKTSFVFDTDTWSGAHLFETPSNGYQYASTSGKNWLMKHSDGWLSFKEEQAF